MRLSFRNLLLAGVVFATANLHAQIVERLHLAPHDIEVAPTLSLVRSSASSGGYFWLQGAGVDASALLYRRLGLAGSVAGVHNGNVQQQGASLTIVTYLAGPRYTWTPPRRLTRSNRVALFGQGLFGAAHGSDGVFPSALGAKSAATCFALQLGGGLDLTVNKRLAVRPVQLDWLHTQFPNAANGTEDSLHIGFGAVFKL